MYISIVYIFIDLQKEIIIEKIILLLLLVFNSPFILLFIIVFYQLLYLYRVIYILLFIYYWYFWYKIHYYDRNKILQKWEFITPQNWYNYMIIIIYFLPKVSSLICFSLWYKRQQYLNKNIFSKFFLKKYFLFFPFILIIPFLFLGLFYFNWFVAYRNIKDRFYVFTNNDLLCKNNFIIKTSFISFIERVILEFIEINYIQFELFFNQID